eukprot:1683192-Prymnesium_polylepis.1
MSAVGASGCRACCPQSNGRANATRPTLPPEARGIGARTSAPAPAFAAGASECGGLRCSLGLRASGRGGARRAASAPCAGVWRDGGGHMALGFDGLSKAHAQVR